MDSEFIIKLTRDIALAARTLSDKEARFLVDAYYMMQDNRIRSGNQLYALSKTEEPHAVLQWLSEQSLLLEKQILRALDKYTDAIPAGIWAKEQYGIGPVIAAGLCARIGDATRFATCGDLWSYSGLAPGQRRKRGEKSNWDSGLKRLAWLMGESFVKVSGKEEALYGQLYRQKKEYYLKKNEAGEFAQKAEQALKDKKYSKDTEAYKAYSIGKLPLAHIHAMACRYAAKIAFSHFWEVSLRAAGKEPPKAYAIAILGHAHEIKPH